MMKRVIFNGILLTLAMFAMVIGFVACKEEPAPAAKNEPGMVNVTITDSTGREVDGYKITVKTEKGSTLTSADTSELSWSGSVASGKIIVRVDACKAGNVVGSSFVPVTLPEGGNADVAAVVKLPVLLEIEGAEKGFDTIEAAIPEIPSGKDAVIAINGEVSVKSTITVEGFNLTLTNADGATAVINDNVETAVTDTGSTSNQVYRMFQINGASNLTVTGNENGKLLFKGTPDNTTNGMRRVLFFLGVKNADKATGMVTINDGVEVTGIDCKGTTAFGTIVRGYGNVTINGGYFHHNYQNGNGLFCCYGNTVVNGGVFDNNTSSGSSSIIQNASSGAKLIINDGKFTNNTANYACVITVAGATTTVNGGEFENNTANGANRGAALHGNDAETVNVTINGGKFSNNVPYDYFRNKSNLVVAEGVSLNTN